MNRFAALCAGMVLTAAAAAVQAASPAPVTSAPAVWNLTELYASPAAWETERLAIQAQLPTLAAHKGKLATDAPSLLNALDAVSALRKRLYRLSLYASLKADEDTRIGENEARRQLANSLDSKFGEAIAYLGPEITALGAAKVNAFLAAEPRLAKHRYFLQNSLRLADHTLSQKEETLLAAAGEPLQQPGAIYELLANADIPWPTIKIRDKSVRLDQEGYVAARSDRDPAVRKQVFDTFWPQFKQFERTFGATYAANLRGTVFQAKARQYPNSLAMALSPYNTPEAVYRTLVAETNAGLPTLHRYFALSKKLLGLKELRYSDIYVPLAKPPRAYTLAEAQQLTLEAVKPLGQEYASDLSRGFAGGWMHALPQPGKASGAYMNGAAYDLHPYLLMSFSGGWESVSTLAHEWGHAMHTVQANRAQPFETADYALFIAEIPSTTNEMLLADHVIANARTKAEKIFAISQELELLRSTFFRQAMFAEFELAAHEAIERGEALTGEQLSKMYLDLLKRYHGDQQGVMKIDDLYGIEWAYISHFYRDFYVFQYATSISAAAYFADGIERGDATVRQKYFDMLRAGGSADPYQIVKAAGLDMASPTPYRALVKRMDRLMDELERVQAGN
ncbi:oligoendopeptidase F [Chitinimonas sp.]|uniref:oligoendopeptidase F n=1 Tax=Chitinimonas sp. TaxID=1934313 RepID=UPI0035AEE00E